MWKLERFSSCTSASSLKFSVVIPAHNEEKFIGKCFEAIERARTKTKHPVEVVVCLNRCTDKTEYLAREFGATIAKTEEKNLSRVRNVGVRASSGDVVVTIDADSQMSPNMFCEIERLLTTKKYIGGGTRIFPERWSLGIFLSLLVVIRFAWKSKIPSAGLFWCYRKDFEAVNGFNESLLTLEDLDFAKRLKAYGKSVGKNYGTLWRASITTSCRKFDRFGDWYFVKNTQEVRALFESTNQPAADKFYYEIER